MFTLFRSRYLNNFFWKTICLFLILASGHTFLKANFSQGYIYIFFWISTVYHLIHMTCFQPVKIQTLEGLSECLCTFWNLKKSENLEKGLRKLLCFCQSMWWNRPKSVFPWVSWFPEYLSSQSILVPEFSRSILVPEFSRSILVPRVS